MQVSSSKSVSVGGIGARDTVPSGRPRIRVVDLVKSYRRHSDGGTVIPVNHVSLDVPVNEMLVLLGPSGCGKTTLLRCIAGLEKPDSGEIYINDELAYSSKKGIFLPPNKRAISMVFQSYALWPHLTIYENVAYPLRARNVPGRDIKGRVMEALSVVGLDKLAQQYPGQISGGQQQRVALARAVVPETGVVLFDEPLSNVDAKVREQLRVEIRNMQRSLGFSAVYVTHDQNEAMAVADRIAVLGDGVIEQLGTSEEVYNMPRSIYVGTFIGGANTIAAEVTGGSEDIVTVSVGFGELRIDKRSNLLADHDDLGTGNVTVLVRPEKILLSSERGSDENCFECVVDTRTFLGSHVEYLLRTQNGQILRAYITTQERLEEGETAWATLPPGYIRLITEQLPS